MVNPTTTSINSSPTIQFSSRGARYAPHTSTCNRCSAVTTIKAVAPKLCSPRTNHPAVSSSWMNATDAQAVWAEGA